MKPKLMLAAIFSILVATISTTQAQSKYFDKNCDVTFLSSTPLEDIEGKNTSAVAVMDIASGAIEVSVLVKAFSFEKALLEEHFNENYMESEKFPKATFKGKIKNISEVKLTVDGTYPITLAGTLTMHGVSREITNAGTIKVKDGIMLANADFIVKPEDYNIEIPGMVKDKIAKEIAVKVAANLQPYIN